MDIKLVKYLWKKRQWFLTKYNKKCYQIGTENLVKIGNINVKLPKFNSYSLDPLCDGINTDEFPLCSKYLEYQPSYETFVKKIEEYKKTKEIKYGW